jgi:hypothetical protein
MPPNNVYLRTPSLLLLFVLFSPSIHADVTFQSGPSRTSLLELYTSEGCSSCPPAESWFSTLRQSPRLWKDIVPVAFHVNYWDDLGWTDSLASPAFTTRQRDYAAAWGADSVYTPAFVLNGREWRDRDLDSIPASEGKPGTLSATLHKNGDVQVTFLPSAAMPGKLQAFVALLGYGVTSDVKAGENSGRTLIHDFVALDLQKSALGGNL